MYERQNTSKSGSDIFNFTSELKRMEKDIREFTRIWNKSGA
jgi:hypothetical protein